MNARSVKFPMCTPAPPLSAPWSSRLGVDSAPGRSERRASAPDVDYVARCRSKHRERNSQLMHIGNLTERAFIVRARRGYWAPAAPLTRALGSGLEGWDDRSVSLTATSGTATSTTAA